MVIRNSMWIIVKMSHARNGTSFRVGAPVLTCLCSESLVLTHLRVGLAFDKHSSSYDTRHVHHNPQFFASLLHLFLSTSRLAPSDNWNIYRHKHGSRTPSPPPSISFRPFLCVITSFLFNPHLRQPRDCLRSTKPRHTTAERRCLPARRRGHRVQSCLSLSLSSSSVYSRVLSAIV